MKLFSFFPLVRSARRAAAALLAFCLIATLLRADVVFAWNELLLHCATHSAGPVSSPLQVRAFAMAHLAMNDAIGAVSTNESTPANRIAEQRAAAVSAARAVLLQLIPAASSAIETLAEQHLGAITEGEAKTRGKAIGQNAAARILAQRQGDGWVEIILFNPPAGPVPEVSETMAESIARGQAMPASPWLKAAPFRTKSAEQFQATELREFTRSGEVVPSYFLQYSKLFNRVDAAAALASRAGWQSSTPVVAWNRIARQVSAARSVDLAAEARMLASLNVALADAMLAALHSRHTIGSWRAVVMDRWLDGPIVRSNDGSLSAHLDMTHLDVQRLLIPPVRDYPAIAPTLAGAAQSVLQNFFGTDEIVFTLPMSIQPGDVASGQRTYTRISAVALECAYVTSLDGGVREACIAGYSLGAAVGRYVAKTRVLARR
jgi:hypothetical protein